MGDFLPAVGDFVLEPVGGGDLAAIAAAISPPFMSTRLLDRVFFGGGFRDISGVEGSLASVP